MKIIYTRIETTDASKLDTYLGHKKSNSELHQYITTKYLLGIELSLSYSWDID